MLFHYNVFLFSPPYRLQTLLFQPFVATGEMAVSEPTATVGGEGRGVDGLKNEVLLLVDETLLVARIAAPKQEDNMGTFTGDGLDDGIRELFPSFPLVRSGNMLAHGQCGVEEQHSLFRPSAERTVIEFPAVGILYNLWNGAYVVLYLFENVDKGRWQRYACLDRKAQTFRLTCTMVWVLPYYYDLHLVNRTEVEGIENLVPGRITSVMAVFLAYKTGESDKVIFVKLTL